MKKRIILLAVSVFFIALGTYAQKDVSLSSTKKWQVSTIGIKVQPYFQQKFSNLSYETLLALVKDPSKLTFDMDGFEVDNYTDAIEGSSVGLFARFSGFQRRGISSELELAFSFTSSEVVSDYYEESTPSAPWRGNYIGWCLVENRFDLEASYLVNIPVSKGFVFSVGPSIGLGTSFNNELIMFDDAQLFTNYEQRAEAVSTNFMYGHAVFQVSKEFLRRWRASIGGKFGVGKQKGQNNSVSSSAAIISLDYRLKK